MYNDGNAARGNEIAHGQVVSKGGLKQEGKGISRPLTKRLQACVPGQG